MMKVIDYLFRNTEYSSAKQNRLRKRLPCTKLRRTVKFVILLHTLHILKRGTKLSGLYSHALQQAFNAFFSFRSALSDVGRTKT